MVDTDTNMADTNDPSVPTSSCPFQKVPLEVLLRITGFLTTPELGNVRLTCRSIERSLDVTFVKEFFTRKQFMLSDDSLQALLDISKSRLGQHLRMVHFGLDRYPPHLHGRRDEQREFNYLRRYASMFTLWSTGYHRDLLTEAFRNLKNLDDIVIRDFNSNRRTRDGNNKEWTSYGSTTASAELGIPIAQTNFGSFHGLFHDPTIPFSNQIFSAVLFALGQAEARPKGIEVMSRRGNHLKDFAFHIPIYMETSVLPVLQNLEKLHVDVDLSWRPSGFGPVAGRQPEMADYFLRKFLLNTPNLRHLRINEINSEDKVLKPVLEWLSKPSSATPQHVSPHVPVVPYPSFPLLDELNLGLMNFEASTILDVARKFAPTLKRFALNRVTLDRPLPDGHLGAPPKRNFWHGFLEKLTAVPGLNLHHIEIRAAQQAWQTRPVKSRVSFDGKHMMAYTGPDWKYFVTDMTSKIVVDHLHDPGDNPDSDEDDDEDGEDDGPLTEHHLFHALVGELNDESIAMLDDPVEWMLQDVLAAGLDAP